MRSACSLMTLRKRSRTWVSSLAAPCRVSTKPLSEASGVRSSWLALATKSARMRASRSCSLRSRNEMRSAGPSAPDRDGRAERRWPAGAARRARARAARRRRSRRRQAPGQPLRAARGRGSWRRRGRRAVGSRTGPRPCGWRARHSRRGRARGGLRHGVDHHAPSLSPPAVDWAAPRAPLRSVSSDGLSAAQAATAASPTKTTRATVRRRSGRRRRAPTPIPARRAAPIDAPAPAPAPR